MLQPGDIVCLQGDLGSGKTCLTQGIGAGLRVAGPIHSPTFVFVNEHEPLDDGPRLYHVDLYRIKDSRDALDLGLEDYLYSDGVTVIEWAERVAELVPDERLWITLTFLDHTKRSLFVEASGGHPLEVLLSLKGKLFGQSKKPSAPSSQETEGD